MITSVLLLFFPKRCSACSDILLYNENEICTNCRNDIPLIDPKIFTQKYIYEIFSETIDIEGFSSLFYFEKHTEVQELLHNLKYRNYQHLGKIIGDWHASILSQNEALNTVDIIIPMPIHKNRLKQRGYNQVSLYAKAIANKLDAECREDILLKIKDKRSQVFLSRDERFNNILNSINVSNPSEISGKHILLVDDLITTGATMSACVSCLKEISCKISIASMALVQHEGL